MNTTATISTFLACENTRIIDPKKPKSIIFDAQLWIAPGVAPICAAFRYFNGHDFVFENHSIFFVHANVSLSSISDDFEVQVLINDNG